MTTIAPEPHVLTYVREGRIVLTVNELFAICQGAHHTRIAPSFGDFPDSVRVMDILNRLGAPVNHERFRGLNAASDDVLRYIAWQRGEGSNQCVPTAFRAWFKVLRQLYIVEIVANPVKPSATDVYVEKKGLTGKYQ